MTTQTAPKTAGTSAHLPGEQRTAWARLNPEALRAMLALEESGAGSLEPALRELIRMRASGLNNCAYCLDMHAHEASEKGETLQRLVAVGAWREAKHLFTPREQAALALTDAVTRLGEDGVPDEVWDTAAAVFDEKELVHVLVSVVTINAWNRLGVATRLHVKERH